MPLHQDGDSEAGVDPGRPPFARLESVLQELSRHEERASLQSMERASVRTQQRLLKDQLLEAQEELAAAEASKAKLCEEVGALQQAKQHQAKQLAKYKVELQSTRESQAALMKKVDGLEESTQKTKQQYIRSLACRMKTAAHLLRQLHLANGLPDNEELVLKSNEWTDLGPNKRRQLAEEASTRKLEGAGVDATDAKGTRGAESSGVPEAGPTTLHDQMLDHDSKECGQRNVQYDHASAQLRDKIALCEAEYAALDDKYQKLAREHAALATSAKEATQSVQQRDDQIKELGQKLAKQSKVLGHNDAAPAIKPKGGEEESDIETRLKVLTENLAQMNGYADQLELVIAQCPSCTAKLQSENTQEAADKPE